jgi:hypothetical protein
MKDEKLPNNKQTVDKIRQTTLKRLTKRLQHSELLVSSKDGEDG